MAAPPLVRTPSRTPLRTLVRRHPFAVFATLACVFGWSLFGLAALGLGSEPDNLPLGPLAAAAVVTAGQGRLALAAWWRRLRRWAMAPWLYAVALVGPVALHLLDVTVNTALGAPLPTGGQLSGWPQLLPGFVVALVMVGIGEEAGWSAFAAPLLRARHGLLATWGLLAGVRVLWHLPLLLSGEMSGVVWLLGNAGFQLLLLVVFELPRARWVFAAVWHTTLNTFGGAFFFSFVTGADRARLDLLLGVTYAVAGAAAAVLLVLLRRRGLARGPVASRWEDDAVPARVGDC